MTDNGSTYRSHDFHNRLAQLAIRHIRTRPYTPKTNGKAERFIQTPLREWAYARAYQSSAERNQAMQPRIASYYHTRPHSAPRRKTTRRPAEQPYWLQQLVHTYCRTGERHCLVSAASMAKNPGRDGCRRRRKRWVAAWRIKLAAVLSSWRTSAVV
jgi:hypothetical protein